MASDGSITGWIGQLKAGDQAAAQQLWERYFHRLVGLARKKLRGTRRRAADEEDVALSAFDSFCRGAENGRFPQLGDRDNLWHLLVVLTARKAWHLRRDEARQKRARVVPWPEGDSNRVDDVGMEQIVGQEPSPEFAASVAEEYELLLSRLADPEMEAIAIWKMEGFTNEEIAAKLDCSLRTIERKLRIIRGRWAQEDRA
ncbi:MAG TPA: ECF-type sigma factor [Gemmataceae bacterium]|nr:ECF-type sigma factor [Gemmataceae bacterium]